MARKRKCHRVLLTIVKIANGGAVLAAGGIIDLPCVPPGLRRDLFFCASTGAHLLTWRALGPKNIKKEDEDEERWWKGFLSPLTTVNTGDKKWEQTYATASVFWTGFQDRVTVLLNDGGLWKRSWNENKDWSKTFLKMFLVQRKVYILWSWSPKRLCTS